MNDNKIPEFIEPMSIMSMSSDQLDTLLEGIRHRRLEAVRRHEDAMRVAKETADERARAALLKQCELLSNELVRAGKVVEKMEDRVNKIRALRLELGME